MADEVKYYRLIVTAPGTWRDTAFSNAIGDMLKAFSDNIPSASATLVDVYTDSLGSGLPYHVPFSFELDAGNEFKWQLEAAGCKVRMTDVGA